MKLLLIASLLSINLAACTEAAEEVGPATTGVYRLEAHPIIETCSPSDTQTEWTVGLFRSADGLSYASPDESPRIGSIQRMETDAALLSEFEIPTAGTCSHGHFRHRFEVTSESPDRVEAMLDHIWSDVVRCPDDPVNTQLPAGDCRTLRALTYQLIEPCESPCVVLDVGDGYTCSC